MRQSTKPRRSLTARRSLDRLIPAICDWYCRAFGSEAAFAIALVVFLLWAAAIPFLGWQAWNTGPGLLGNTTESTIELFFAIATLVLAGRITAHQAKEREQTDALLAKIEEQGKRIEELGELLLDQLHNMER